MKKSIIPLLVFFLMTVGSSAQQINGVAVFSKIGYTSLTRSTAILNKVSPGSGFSNDFILFGTEGYFRTNKLILGLDGTIGLQNRKLSSRASIEASAGALYARGGYIIAEKKHYWVYPSIGAGIAGIDIDMKDYTTDEVARLKNKLISSPSLDLGINADFIVNKLFDQGDYGALLFGLRAGYRMSIKKSWADNDGNKLANMPSYGYNGFYIMATIGGGAFIRK